MKKERSFTLIELLVVLAIIGLLSSVILVAVQSARDKASIAKVLQYSASVKHVLGAYILGEWSFEDNCNDTSGNGNNGTCTDIIFSDNDISELGKASGFNGTTSKLDTGSDFIGALPFTICAWINPEGWGEINAGVIVDNNVFIYRILFATKSLSFNDGLATVSATNSIILNKWQFVCMTTDVARLTNFYIDGVLSGTANQDAGVGGAGGNIFIGNRSDSGRTFDGNIDEVRIYREVLSSAQIQKLYAERAKRKDLVIE